MARASYIRLDDDNIRFLLEQHAQLDFIVLAHINNSPLVDMSFHSGTLFWFRAKQFLLLGALCLRRSNKYQIYSLWFDPTGGRNHKSTAL